MRKRLIDTAISLFSWIAWRTPRPLRWALASLLGFIWFDVLRLRRYSVLRGISIAFPDLPKAQRYQLARKSMRYLCYHLPEVLALPRLTQEAVKTDVIFDGWENYEEALKKNKGVLGLSLHLGNGDMAASSLAMNGMKVNLITKRMSNKVMDEIWFGMREGHGAKFIDPHGVRSAHEIISAIKKNECVIFVLDQFIAAPFGVEMEFFGRKTGTGIGLARFAQKLGAPVLPIYTYRDQDLRTHLVIEPEIILPPRGELSAEAHVIEMTKIFSLKMEELIRKYPAQWMWVHRRWKKWR